MDEFKKYLQQHRNQMDEDIPGEALLQRIHAASNTVKKASVFSIVFRIAAAACLLVCITVGARWAWQKKNTPPELGSKEGVPIIKDSGTALVTDSPDTTLATTGTINRNETTAPTTTAVKQPGIPAQLLQSFSYNYTQLVNLQLKNIRRTPVYGETGNYFNDFKYTLQQMDAVESKIKSTIKKSGLNDILLEQLINVYQQKLDLLKNLQHEINKLNNRVKENQLPTDSVPIHFINI